MPSIAPFILLVNLSETNTTNANINITEEYFADDDIDFYDYNFTNATNTTNENFDNQNKNVGAALIVLIVLCCPFLCFIACGIYANCKDCCISTSTTSRVWEKDRKRAIKIAKKNAKKEQQIVKYKLSSSFIKNANEENRQCHREHAEKCGENDCAICMTPITFDKGWTLLHCNSDKKKNIYLNCGHDFHTSCLQAWVKSKALNNESIICPLCRAVIAYNPPDTITNMSFYSVYDSDSDSIDDRDYY